MAVTITHATVAVGKDAGNGEIRKSQWNANHTVKGAAGTGIYNRIINPAMQVDQRNTAASQTITAGAALAYTVDQWYAFCTGANITGQQITTSGVNRYRFTGATSNTGVGFGQRIEAVNSADISSGNVTISVKLSSSSLTSITWTLYYATSTDSFGTLASPTRTQISTGTFTITSSEAVYTTTVSMVGASPNGLELVFTGGALVASQTLTIGDVQLEPGDTATDFYPRPYGQELLLCQRYYQTIGSIYGGGNGGSQVVCSIQPRVPMRAVPTIGQTGVISMSTMTTDVTQSSTGLATYTSLIDLLVVGLQNMSTATANVAFFSRGLNSNVVTLSAVL